MQNEMRDRLVEVFKKIEYTSFLGSPFKANLENQFTDYALYSICDDLIENGVVVPPCKVGDKVYCLCTLVDDDFCEGCEFYYGGGMGDMPCCDATRHGERKKECIVVCEEVATEKEIYWWLYMNDFGKTVFLTKEQAEQKLKEMRGGNAERL